MKVWLWPWHCRWLVVYNVTVVFVVGSESDAWWFLSASAAQRRGNCAAETSHHRHRDWQLQGHDVTRHAAAGLERSLVHLLQAHQERLHKVKALHERIGVAVHSLRWLEMLCFTKIVNNRKKTVVFEVSNRLWILACSWCALMPSIQRAAKIYPTVVCHFVSNRLELQ